MCRNLQQLIDGIEPVPRKKAIYVFYRKSRRRYFNVGCQKLVLLHTITAVLCAEEGCCHVWQALQLALVRRVHTALL